MGWVRSRTRSCSDSRTAAGRSFRRVAKRNLARLNFEIERDVQCWGRMSQRAYADAIDARLGHETHGVEIDAARGLKLNGRRQVVATAYGLGDQLRSEIVDEDDIGSRIRAARSNCSSESTSISMVVPRGVFALADCDCNGHPVLCGRPGSRLQPCQMIVLDQHGIVQAKAMIDAAAAPHRVLFQRPQPGVVLRVS